MMTTHNTHVFASLQNAAIALTSSIMTDSVLRFVLI